MTLIGNYAMLNKTPGRWLGGSSQSADRSNWSTPGSVRNIWVGWAGLNARIAHPGGYNPEYSQVDAPKSGGIASTIFIAGSGGVSAGNLAGGRNGVGPLTGTGDITNAACGLILSAVAALTGSGDLTGDMLATLQAVADLAGTGDLVGALGALAGLAAALAGTGDASVTARADGELGASLNVTGDLLSTGNVGEAVWSYLAEGDYTAAGILRILASVAAGKTNIAGSTVTFRDLSDVADRVVAAMTGSERTTVTLTQD